MSVRWLSRIVLVAGWLLAGLTPPSLAGELALTDSKGRLRGLLYQDDLIDLATDLVVASPGWKITNSLDHCWDVAYEPPESQHHWAGTIWFDGPNRVHFEQKVQEAGGQVDVTIKVEALAESGPPGVVRGLPDAGGVICRLDVETGRRAGTDGRVGIVHSAVRAPFAAPRLHESQADGFTLLDPAGPTVQIRFDRACPLTLQDQRNQGDDRYSLSVCIRAAGGMKKGEAATFIYHIRMAGTPERDQATLTLSPGRKLYRLEGFGGDFAAGLHLRRGEGEPLQPAHGRCAHPDEPGGLGAGE